MNKIIIDGIKYTIIARTKRTPRHGDAPPLSWQTDDLHRIYTTDTEHLHLYLTPTADIAAYYAFTRAATHSDTVPYWHTVARYRREAWAESAKAAINAATI